MKKESKEYKRYLKLLDQIYAAIEERNFVKLRELVSDEDDMKNLNELARLIEVDNTDKKPN